MYLIKYVVYICTVWGGPLDQLRHPSAEKSLSKLIVESNKQRLVAMTCCLLGKEFKPVHPSSSVHPVPVVPSSIPPVQCSIPPSFPPPSPWQLHLEATKHVILLLWALFMLLLPTRKQAICYAMGMWYTTMQHGVTISWIYRCCVQSILAVLPPPTSKQQKNQAEAAALCSFIYIF